MKSPNKRERQHIAFTQSSDDDFQEFMNFYIKCTLKPYSSLVIDTSFASDNPLPFRNNLSEGIWKLTMTIDDKIKDEKLQFDINREAARISASSSGKIDKNEYLTIWSK